ncbi:MAG: rhodanese-like domain-containing protein [Acidobacteriota bacterium]
MRVAILISMIFVLSIGLLAGCISKDSVIPQTPRASGQTSQSPTPAAPADAARRITAEEAYKLYERGELLVIDTRTEPVYKESRIKGAILIPVNEVAAKADELPRDKMIVTYCT